MMKKIKKFFTRTSTKDKHDEKRLVIKFLICLVYLIVITILFVCAYKLYEEKKEIVPWDKVESVDEYTYIEIDKMSEKFAYYAEENIGLHFVIEKEDTGQWHTYIIAINEDEYSKYQAIIDYTYERTLNAPEPIKVYGYPVIVSDNIKQMAVKNIVNFVPAENEVTITTDNFDNYLTNSFLDTTQERKDSFSPLLCLTGFLLFIMIGLLIFTIFDRDKIVDNIDDKYDELKRKTKKRLKLRR